MKSSLVLAFIGDSVWELKIRMYFINLKPYKVNELQSITSRYASAKMHYKFINFLIDNNELNEGEISIYKRGRNAKVNTRRKNFDSTTYHASTGFEALIGYLYLNNQEQRIDELVNIIIKEYEK
ncbi:MAG: Mini-ribonuclease 3 [Bacilli bacterium]|jgi:ribonuclease-3 family protein|nr:Mini-ribonuclease 3 [Bacilli bacterium]